MHDAGKQIKCHLRNYESFSELEVNKHKLELLDSIVVRIFTEKLIRTNIFSVFFKIKSHTIAIRIDDILKSFLICIVTKEPIVQVLKLQKIAITVTDSKQTKHWFYMKNRLAVLINSSCVMPL